jgi:hypothetical protein
MIDLGIALGAAVVGLYGLALLYAWALARVASRRPPPAPWEAPELPGTAELRAFTEAATIRPTAASIRRFAAAIDASRRVR